MAAVKVGINGFGRIGRQMFRALVELQDEGMAVAESRAAIGERYGLTEAQIRRIEEEGMDNEWPPL